MFDKLEKREKDIELGMVSEVTALRFVDRFGTVGRNQMNEMVVDPLPPLAFVAAKNKNKSGMSI